MSKRILLADDSLTIQKVVELTFMDEDFEVEAVSSGDEAVSRLSGDLPDMVIADVHMPGASGYEVCRRAKAASAGLPVLLLVGTFEALDEDELVACGADGNLKKPFDSQELLQIVRRMTEASSEGSVDGGFDDVGTAEEGEEQGAESTEAVEGLETTAHDEAADDEGPETDSTEVSVTGFDMGRETDDFAVTPPEPTPSGFETVVSSDLEAEPEIESVDLGLDAGEEDAPETAADEVVSGNETVLIDTASQAEADEEPESEEVTAPEPEAVLEVAADPEPAVEAPEGIALDDTTDELSDMMPADDEPAVDVGHDLDVAPPLGAEGGPLSDSDVERIARRVVEMMSDDAVREVAWEVIPDMAEIVIKDRIREIEAEADAD